MRAAEEAAFASSVSVEALMNKAGTGVAQAVTKFFQKPGRCIVFAGKGNKGTPYSPRNVWSSADGKSKCAWLSMKLIAAISCARS
jgi:hypothetical protein